MINELLKNEAIAERLNSLPEVIRRAVTQSNWEEKIRVIGKKNDLVIGDAAILEKNTLLVMLGLESPKEYKNLLKEELKLDEEKLEKIVDEVESEIFKDIRQRLIDFLDEEEMEENKEGLEEDTSEVSPTQRESTIKNRVEPNTQISEEKRLSNKPIEDEGQNNLVEENLTTSTDTQKETIKPLDPYREPLE